MGERNKKTMLERGVPAVCSVRFRVDPSEAGLRLSRCVAGHVDGLSVRGAKELIDRGRIFVNDKRVTMASIPVLAEQWIEAYPDERGNRVRLREEDILWEGESLVAVNKPPGLLVYGSQGVTEDTVLPQLEGVLKRAGRWEARKDRLVLVHRLDRDTSGLLLVARNEKSARALERQFRQRTVEKRYLALASGRFAEARFRQASAVAAKRPAHGSKGFAAGLPRPAARKAGPAARKAGPAPGGETRLEVLEVFSACTLLEARPLTGRTHQIRVHLAQLGHPILGDILYGAPHCPDPFHRAISRQMLHASFLGFEDPDRGGRIEIAAPMPEDMSRVLSRLRKGRDER